MIYLRLVMIYRVFFQCKSGTAYDLPRVQVSLLMIYLPTPPLQRSSQQQENTNSKHSKQQQQTAITAKNSQQKSKQATRNQPATASNLTLHPWLGLGAQPRMNYENKFPSWFPLGSRFVVPEGPVRGVPFVVVVVVVFAYVVLLL